MDEGRACHPAASSGGRPARWAAAVRSIEAPQGLMRCKYRYSCRECYLAARPLSVVQFFQKVSLRHTRIYAALRFRRWDGAVRIKEKTRQGPKSPASSSNACKQKRHLCRSWQTATACRILRLGNLFHLGAAARAGHANVALAARNGKNGTAGLAAEEQRGLALTPHALGGALGAAKVGAGALAGRCADALDAGRGPFSRSSQPMCGPTTGILCARSKNIWFSRSRAGMLLENAQQDRQDHHQQARSKKAAPGWQATLSGENHAKHAKAKGKVIDAVASFHKILHVQAPSLWSKTNYAQCYATQPAAPP